MLSHPLTPSPTAATALMPGPICSRVGHRSHKLSPATSPYPTECPQPLNSPLPIPRDGTEGGPKPPLPPHTVNFPAGQRRGRARSRHAGGRPACPDPCPGRRRKPHCSPKCNFKKHRMPNPRRTIAAPTECAPPGSTEAPRGPHGQGTVSAPGLPLWGWEPPQLPLVPLGRAVSLFFFFHPPLHFSFRSDSFPLL